MPTWITPSVTHMSPHFWIWSNWLSFFIFCITFLCIFSVLDYNLIWLRLRHMCRLSFHCRLKNCLSLNPPSLFYNKNKVHLKHVTIKSFVLTYNNCYGTTFLIFIIFINTKRNAFLSYYLHTCPPIDSLIYGCHIYFLMVPQTLNSHHDH